MSSGLLRYRSAPTSLFGETCEDLLPLHPSSPEAERILARFLRGGDLRDKPPPPPPQSAEEAPPHLFYHNSQQQVPTHGSAEATYHVATSSMAMEGEQIKTCPSLIRHSSSPAGLFSHPSVGNGYGMIRGMEDAGAPASRVKRQVSFSSSVMSQISEMGSEGMCGSSSPEEGTAGQCYIPGYTMSPWDDMLHKLSPPEAQNGESRSSVFSLPRSSSSSEASAAMEKFLQFHDTVPCKLRAKRGCATHPRSIAERVRRTRISERMRKLQELVPNMDKQTNTADMLDLAVEHIKNLQKQVKSLSENRACCTCAPSKQNGYPSP